MKITLFYSHFHILFAKYFKHNLKIWICFLQDLYDEVNKRATDIDNLASRYERLGGQVQFDHEMEPLRQHWSKLMNQIQNLLENRTQQLQMSRDYHDMQMRMAAEMEALRRGDDRYSQDEDALLAEHLEHLQVMHSSFGFYQLRFPSTCLHTLLMFFSLHIN